MQPCPSPEGINPPMAEGRVDLRHFAAAALQAHVANMDRYGECAGRVVHLIDWIEAQQ